MQEKKPMNKLKAARILRGYKQAELSELCGVRVETYAKYEQGVRRPSFETIKKIAEVLNVEVSELI